MLIPLSPPPGLNSDDTTFAAEGKWADGNNVRFWMGKAQPIGGWVSHGAVPVTVQNMFHIKIGSNEWLVYGNEFGIAASAGLTATSSISSVGQSAGDGWAFDAFGQLLLAVPRGSGTLYTWPGTGSAAAVAPAPDVINDMIVTPERQVLALGCNEEVSGTFNGLCIRGSDLEDYTDWATTSTNNAFEHILSDGGSIIAGRMVGSYVAVWTEGGLHIGQFIGDPGQTYRFDQVAGDCGLISADAVTVVGQTAYWLGADLQVRAWSPGAQPAVVPCPISVDFRTNLNRSEKFGIFAYHNTKFSEVWFFYPDTRDAAETGSRYIAFSLVDGAWFRGQLERTAMVNVLLGSGPLILATSSAGSVFTHEDTNAGRAWYIQSADQYLDNGGRRMMIKGVRPDFEDQAGDVSLTVYMRDRPQSASVAKGPYVLTTSTTKKDFRASGMIAAVKFSGLAATYARLGKPCFDAVSLGER